MLYKDNRKQKKLKMEMIKFLVQIETFQFN